MPVVGQNRCRSATYRLTVLDAELVATVDALCLDGGVLWLQRRNDRQWTEAAPLAGEDCGFRLLPPVLLGGDIAEMKRPTRAAPQRTPAPRKV